MKLTAILATFPLALAAGTPTASGQQAPAPLPPPVLLTPAPSDGVSRECAVLRAELARQDASLPIVEQGIRKLERQGADAGSAKVGLAELNAAMARRREEMKSSGCQELATTLLPPPATLASRESAECASLRIELAQFQRWAASLDGAARAWGAWAADQRQLVAKLDAAVARTSAPADREDRDAEAARLDSMLELIANYLAQIDDAKKTMALDQARLNSTECQGDAATRPASTPALLPPPDISTPSPRAPSR